MSQSQYRKERRLQKKANSKAVSITKKNMLMEELTYMSPQEIQKHNKEIEERKALLKESPKYIEVMRRLDEVIFGGQFQACSEYMEGKKSKISIAASIQKTFETIKSSSKDKEVLINVSVDLGNMIIDTLPMGVHLEHIQLELYRYMDMYICFDPALKGFTFMGYSLK